VHDEDQPNAFGIVWPSPVKERSILCTTIDEEINVSFGDWHGHYGPWLNQSDSEAVETALSTVAAILNDEAVVEVSYLASGWAGSRLVHMGEYKDTSIVIAVEEEAGDDLTLETRIQSWSGRLDEVKKI